MKAKTAAVDEAEARSFEADEDEDNPLPEVKPISSRRLNRKRIPASERDPHAGKIITSGAAMARRR